MIFLSHALLAFTFIQVPNIQDTTGYSARFEQIVIHIDTLSEYAGSWPPNIADSVEFERVTAQFHSIAGEIESLAADYPDSVGLLHHLGSLYRMGHNIDVEGAWKKSEDYFKQAIDEVPDNPNSYFELALLYVNSNPGLASDAEDLLEEALDRSGDNPNPYIYQALTFAFLYQRENEDALEAIEEFLKRVPNNRQGVSIRNMILKKLGR